MLRRIVVAGIVVLGWLAVAPPAFAVDPPFDDGVQADSGAQHSCAVSADHHAWCWGDDGYSQLGNGIGGDQSTAEIVLDAVGTAPLAGVRQISAGRAHTCAVLTNNEARCWGNNDAGQLGSGGGSTGLPVAVRNVADSGPLTGVRSIGTGDYHSCALLLVGQVRCWGFNGGGQLGDGTPTSSVVPVVVRSTNGTTPLTGATQLSVGPHHACVRLSNGQARCWGVGEHGRIGDGTQADRHHAVVVKAVTGNGPLTGVRQIVAGAEHTCARVAGNEVRCWGVNVNHQLGVPPGSSPVQSLFAKVVRQNTPGRPPLTGVLALGGGGNTTCAVLTSHQVRCWGQDDNGELGNGTPTGQVGAVAVRSPAGGIDPMGNPPGNLTNITQLSGGYDTLCARRSDGRILCWGSNLDDQVGFGSNNDPVHRPTSTLRTT